MPWWRKLLALLGLSEDARVRVRAPGIEVIITGDPETVRNVLNAVKGEIGRNSSSRRRSDSVIASNSSPPPPAAVSAPSRGPARPSGPSRKKGSVSQLVRPTDLDEMDSPYAIPEHVPAQNHDETETPADGLPAERTMNVDGLIVSTEDDPEPEPTAVDVRNPSTTGLPATMVPQIADVGGERTARSTSGISEEATIDAPRMQRNLVVGKKLDGTDTE